MRRLLAAALLCACVPEPHVAPNDQFTPEEQQAIERAEAKWNTVLRDPMLVRSEGPWRMFKELTPEMQEKSLVGQTDHPGLFVRIKPGLTPDAFYATVLHEFGHVNGLHHVAGPGVMNPTVGATEFTEADLEECRLAGRCGLSAVDEAKCRMMGACP